MSKTEELEVAVVENNSGHNVPARISDAKADLSKLAAVYLETEVAEGSVNTFDAKRADLQRFLDYYSDLYGHLDPREWYRSTTEGFLKHLAALRPAPAPSSLERRFQTIAHFARWIHRYVAEFPLGCPVERVTPPRAPEPDWKGLSRKNELRLLAAAQTLTVRPGRGRNTGPRNYAALAVALGTGLRVSELLALELEHYDAKRCCFRNVPQKGGDIRARVNLSREAQRILEEYLEQRGRHPGPLFDNGKKGPLSRKTFWEALERIRKQANANLPAGEDELEVSPHTLRHTFLRKVYEKNGHAAARDASGHKSDRYIHRYVRPSEEELAQAVHELD